MGPFIRKKGIKYIPYPSVERLLAFFENAEYVLVNSFHGTVFSILFHKKFYTKLEKKMEEIRVLLTC